MKNALKKFKDLFFEEEIIEVVEETDDEPVVNEPVFENIRLSNEKEEVVEKVETSKKSELLTIQPAKDKSKVVAQPKPQVKKPEVSSVVNAKKTDYEFTQVISPIYGLKDSQDQSQPVTKKISPKKVSALKSPIGTVLSPMYGVYEENPLVQEVEVEPEISDLKVDDFIERKEEPKKTDAKNGIVNLSLFDDDEQ